MNLDENMLYKRLIARLKQSFPTGGGSVAWTSISGIPVTFPADWSTLANKPTYAAVATSGAYSDLSGRPTLFSGAYGDLTGSPSLFAGTWAALSGKPTTLAGFGITDAVTGAALTSSLLSYLTTSAAAATYYPSSSNPAAYLTAASITGKADKATTLAGYGITDAVTGAALTAALTSYTTAALTSYTTTAALTTLLAAKANVVVPAYSYPTRALNTAVQLSATRDAEVDYPVDVAITSLLTATAGIVFLEYADNVAMTTNLVNVMSGQSAVGGVLNITNTGTVLLHGRIPAGKYVRIRTAIVSGAPSFASRQGAEVLL